jgi:hypothetical protein
MKDSFEAFLAEVLADIPEDRRGAIEETFKMDAVRSRVERGVQRQQDYSRNLDKLREEREELERMRTDTVAEHQTWQGWYDTASSEYEAMRQRIQELESEDEGMRAAPAVSGITQDEFARQLAERDKLAISFSDVLVDLKMEHRDKFHEKLDTNKLIDHAMKRGMSIDIAYRDLMAPRLEELDKAKLDKQLLQAREEGAREALTKHRLPTTSGPVDAHVLDLAPKVQGNQGDRVSAAVAGWMNAQHTP